MIQIQRNGYKIGFSRLYNRFYVKKGNVVYEEFEKQEDAIKWANNN